MGRSPCCEDRNLKKGPWTPEEDQKLVEYISKSGHGSWRALPKLAGLNRCGKSCRLRWTNYLRPDIKRGKFSDAEEEIIIKIHSVLGNKWSRIAAHLPGRTDNEIKNFWNTHVKKKFLKMGLDPNTHQPRTDFNSLLSLNNLTDVLRSGGAAAGPTKVQLLHNILQMINAASVLSQNMKGASPLGSYYNPTPLEGFVSSTEEYHHPNIQGPVGFPNSGVETPESNKGYQQGVSNSWAGIDGGLGSEVLDFKNKYCSISASHDDALPLTEQKLPGLVSFSPESSNIVNQMEGELMMNNPACASAVSSISDIFEAWGELIDDETGASYWKDLYP